MTPKEAASPTLIIDRLGGQCPVQGEGTVNGMPFYFRARGEHWSMSIGENPVGVSVGCSRGWYRARAWGDKPYSAGWMDHDEARQIIEQCAAAYVNGEASE